MSMLVVATQPIVRIICLSSERCPIAGRTKALTDNFCLCLRTWSEGSKPTIEPCRRQGS